MYVQRTSRTCSSVRSPSHAGVLAEPVCVQGHPVESLCRHLLGECGQLGVARGGGPDHEHDRRDARGHLGGDGRPLPEQCAPVAGARRQVVRALGGAHRALAEQAPPLDLAHPDQHALEQMLAGFQPTSPAEAILTGTP